MATGRKLGRIQREYKVVYYNTDSKLNKYARIPWFKHAYTMQDARKMKRKLENEGKIDVDILVYDTTIYRMC